MTLALVVAAVAALAGGAAWWLTRLRPVDDPADVRVGPATTTAVAARHPGLRRALERRADPTVATGLALTMAALVASLGAFVVGALLEMVQQRDGLARWDDAAARFGVRHLTAGSRSALEVLTQLGTTRVVVPLAIVVALAEYRRRPRAAVFGFLALAIGGTVAINNLVKTLVGRARPDVARLVGFSGSSFPSGHASAAAVTYAALALVVGRGRSRRTKAVLAGVAATLAAAVAASRVLLGVHWLTDVLAGLALGWGWFAVSSIVFGGRLLHFGQPIQELHDQAVAVDRERVG